MSVGSPFGKAIGELFMSLYLALQVSMKRKEKSLSFDITLRFDESYSIVIEEGNAGVGVMLGGKRPAGWQAIWLR
jgi:hypothetical protein